jgi:hypothetical protein
MEYLMLYATMPTEKPKIIFVADDKLQNRLDDYRFENRIKTQSEAIRRLLDDALSRYERKRDKAR